MKLDLSQSLVVLSILPYAAAFLPAPIVGGRATRCWVPSAATASPGASHEAADLTGKERLKRFLEDAAFLGPIRFIAMNDGAILESVGSFEGVSYKELPKGEYATFSSEDKTFEAHLNLNQVAGVTMASSKAKNGDHMNYFVRFLDKEDKILMTTMLHKPFGPEGQYEDDAVEWWEKLRGIFGDNQQIQ